MNAHTNPYVEAWALKREHIEKTFRWSPKSLTIIALAGVAFPLWLYKTGVREFVRAQGCAGARGAAGGVGRGCVVGNLNALQRALTLPRPRARRR